MSDPTLITEEIIWTALPNGFVGDGEERKLRLSVLVSPRLKIGARIDPSSDLNRARLDLFSDFLDWPLTLAGIKFVVHIGTASFFEDNQVTRVSAPDSTLWQALFR